MPGAMAQEICDRWGTMPPPVLFYSRRMRN
ncbi:hypothetical protein BDI4_280013 [Burkholderia diffusa]|nr:hypothetical protein BDI4_280013 [Burkholderia diffusa]